MKKNNPMLPILRMNIEILNTCQQGEWQYEAASNVIRQTNLSGADIAPADLHYWLKEIAYAYSGRAATDLPWKTSARKIAEIDAAARKLQTALTAASDTCVFGPYDIAPITELSADLRDLRERMRTHERDLLGAAERYAGRPHDAVCWLIGGALPLVFWVLFSKSDVPFPKTLLPQDETRARVKFIQGCFEAYGLEIPNAQNIHKQLSTFKATRVDPENLFFLPPPGNTYQRDRLLAALEAMNS